MAISTNAVINFFGSQSSDLGTTTSAVSNDAFSDGINDLTTFTNTDDSPSAAFVLVCQFGTAPTDGSVINLYARKMNIQSTNDSPVPSAANTDQLIGNFEVDGDLATSTDMYLPTEWLDLPDHSSQQVYEFYIENKTGQTISAGWEFYVTPVTKGPHA